MDLQAREKGYDLEANLALLKLYQFNPTHTNMAVVVQVVTLFLFNFLLIPDVTSDPLEIFDQPSPHRLFCSALQEGAENDQKAGRKKSLTDRFKTRILKSDPRSASEVLDRTPIAVEKDGCDTPARNPKELVLGGEVVLERNPLVMQQRRSSPQSGIV